MVIIARYLAREITYAMIAVTLIMLFIFMCNKLVRYLGFIAKGKYAAWVLVHIILLQIPVLLGLLLPLGLYLGILLAYGRLYADSEMTVLSACGFSQKQLIGITMAFAFLVMILVGIFSIWVQPAMTLRSEQVLAEAKSGSILQTISPGQFREVDSGSTKRVFYVQNLSRGHKHMENVFMAQKRQNGDKKGTPSSWEVMYADAGHEAFDPQTHNDYLVTTNGQIYKGVPGGKSFQIIHYKNYGVRANDKSISSANTDPETMPITHLWLVAKHSQQAAAELQWRLSVPFGVLLLALTALPLSKVKPRQGKFSKFLPAAVIYIIYANLLFAARGWMQNGSTPNWLGMWWPHVILLLVALWLNWRQLKKYRPQRRLAAV